MWTFITRWQTSHSLQSVLHCVYSQVHYVFYLSSGFFGRWELNHRSGNKIKYEIVPNVKKSKQNLGGFQGDVLMYVCVLSVTLKFKIQAIIIVHPYCKIKQKLDSITFALPMDLCACVCLRVCVCTRACARVHVRVRVCVSLWTNHETRLQLSARLW